MKEITHTVELKLKHFWHSKGNIVFVHGFNSSWYKYVPFLQKLYGYGYNIYATELPNHGINNSSTKQCTFNEYVDYMETYIKKLNLKKVVLIGHSMGGGIISVLSQRIENLSAIIFISGLNKTVKQNIIARGLNMMKSGGNIFNTMKKWVEGDENRPSYDPMFLLGNLHSESTLNNIEESLKKVNVPFYTVFGKNDDVIPCDLSCEYLKNILTTKKYDFLIVEDTKHSPHLDKPDFIACKINIFLDENSRE